MQKMWGDVHDLRNDGEAVRRIQRHRNPHLTRDDVVDLQHAQRHTRSMAALTPKKLTSMWAHLSVNARKPKCPHCGSTAGTRHPIGAHEKSHESQCMSCGELAPFSDFYEEVQKPSKKKKRQLPGKGKQVAVDLDGTLAVHDDTIPFDPNHIGEPVEEMLQVVKQYALDGYEPVLFTARASDPANIPPIEAWLKKHGIPIEKITNQKTPEMAVFLDDRARGVEMNTGVLKCATEETGQPYTPIKPGPANWGSVRPADFLRASPDKTNIRESVDQRSWVSPEPDMSALSTPFDAPSLQGPVRRSEAEIATLRAAVKPEYRDLYNERESDKTKPADTYIGTITPGFYKQKVYGDAWTSEIAKAHQYNKQNNLPGDMNLWAKPVPVTKFPGGMDHFKPSPRSIELSANESFDLGTDPNADFNLTREEAAKFKSPLIMQHEATHAGQIDNDVSNFDQKALEAAQDAVRPPFYDDGTFFKTTPVPGLLLPWGVKGSAHDVYAPEMRAYLSALQEHMFKTRGKRIESPEEFDQVMQEIKPDNTLHPDVSRYIRQMQKVKEGRPDIHEILHNWGRRVIPGIVSNEANTPDTVKTAFEQLEYAEAMKATNDRPTDAQKEYGNYKKGRFTWHNIDIAIENPKGSIRRGKSKDGTEWQTVMKNTYGYITSTPGSEADGDKVDVFVGNHPDTQLVGVVDQYAGERFDEHKCILGVTDAKDAEETYLANYEEGWDGCGDVTLLTADQFKQWLLNGDTSRPLKGQKFDEFMKKVAFDRTTDENGERIGNGLALMFPSFFHDKKPGSLEIAAHGGPVDANGYIGYSITPSLNNWFQWDNDPAFVVSDTRQGAENDLVIAPFIRKLLDNGKSISDVYSYACNTGTGNTAATPETYEKLLGHALNKVVMTPEGNYGLPTAGISAVPAKLLQALGMPVAPLRVYEKSDGKWVDKGDYRTNLDSTIGGWVAKITEWLKSFRSKLAAEKFVRPENFESVDDLGKVPNNYKLYVGANDWESCGYTWAALFPEWVSGDLIYDGFNPVRWIHIDHSDCPDCKGDCNRGHKSDYAKQKVREWLAGIELSRLERMYGRKPIESVSKDLGNEGFDITEKTANVAITTPQQPVIPTTGLAAIVYRLKNLDMQALRKKAQDDLATGKKTRRAPAVKLLNIIEGLDRNELKPSDLLLSKIPVLPPIMRPYAVAGDTLIPGDENELYRDMMQALRQRKELSKTFGDEHAHSATKTVYDSAKALMGYGDPVNAETRARGVTGFAQRILGSGPKQSWLISKMIAKPVDAVGRSVISVNPDLNIDQIGLPREMAWKQYQPVLIRHLVKSGMPQMEAIRAVRNRTAIAERAMERIIPENPVIYSRAPAWHKHSVLSGFVKLVDGDAIQVNPYVTTGLGADFDGDTVNVHVPISDDAVDEARNKLLPSKMVLKTRDPESAMPQLKHEQIMGLGSAQVAPAKKRHVFANEAEAIAAVRSGKISMSDEVEWPDPIPVTPVPVGSV